jgi:putative transposase
MSNGIPVRAGLVEQAGDYQWSSAAAHLGGKDLWKGLDMEFWAETGGLGRWASLLAKRDDESELKRLRRATYSGQPCGDGEFRAELLAARKPVVAAGQTTGVGGAQRFEVAV